MDGPEKRHRRPAVSCTLCRRRKLKCNRETPCSNCTRSQHATCIYGPSSSVLRVGTAATARPAVTAPATAASTTVSAHLPLPDASSTTSAAHVEELQNNIWRREEQLDAPRQAPRVRIDTTTSRLGGSFHFNLDARRLAPISRSVTHKARLFGQSHWINTISLFGDVFETIEPHLQGDSSPLCSTLHHCKSLGRLIKSQRAPPWPSMPSSILPFKSVTDELVNCYLRTVETVYRILHIPTFMRDYDALWESEMRPHSPFVVQLKLVLAIGATMYDAEFSLRPSAMLWIYEALAWVSKPDTKSRFSIQCIQIDVLLLLAQELVDVGGEPIWISAGALYRRAVHMGLHRGHAFVSPGSTLTSEMRRRLWNTILELSLQSSITSGGPPFVSLEDFDVEPPGNFDDDQLTAEEPQAKFENESTGTSIAIALRKTFPARLAVAKFLNDINSDGTYEQTLRIDEELRANYKAMCRSLRACGLGADTSTSTFGVLCLDFIMHRYLSALHAPYFGIALREASYAYSRQVIVETSLKIWRAAFPQPCIPAAQLSHHPGQLHKEYMRRLTARGFGFFRTVTLQAVLLIAAELQMQVNGEESLSSVLLRPDLKDVLVNARSWSLQVLQAGETNIKGHLLICVLAAQLDLSIAGLDRDEVPVLLVRAMANAANDCYHLLQESATVGREEGCADTFSDVPIDESENWQFPVPDLLFDSWNADSLSWMLED